MNHSINDSFMNLSRFGNANIPFRLSDKEPRSDVLKWKIARSNARSMGKASFTHTKACRCGNFETRVYNNDCFDCWKLRK
mgnify:FL=1